MPEWPKYALETARACERKIEQTVVSSVLLWPQDHFRMFEGPVPGALRHVQNEPHATIFTLQKGGGAVVGDGLGVGDDGPDRLGDGRVVDVVGEGERGGDDDLQSIQHKIRHYLHCG